MKKLRKRNVFTEDTVEMFASCSCGCSCSCYCNPKYADYSNDSSDERSDERYGDKVYELGY